MLSVLPAAAQDQPADYAGQDLSSKRFVDTDFTGADFTRANLHSAKLDRCVFDGAKMSAAKFYWASLIDVSFVNADLSGAKLDNTQAQGANFRGANVRGATFFGTNLTGADFTGVDLAGVDFRHANLTGVNFTDAKLDGINVDSAIIEDIVGLDEATLDRLHGEAGRFWHDVDLAFTAFVFRHSFPVYLFMVPIGIVLAFIGFRGAPGCVKVSSFVQLAINFGAFVPGVAMVVMMATGGSPTAQMSSGVFWKIWFGLWPLLLILMGLLVLVSLVTGATHLLACVASKPRHRPLLALIAVAVTVFNTLLGVCVMFQLAPDA